MVRIRRFGVIKTATVAALMYVVGVLIFFVPILLIFAAVGSQISTTGGRSIPGFNAGAGLIGLLLAAVLLALLYGILGWIITAIACLVYNLVARWTGGIEVQVESMDPPGAPPLPASWGTARLPGPAGPAAWNEPPPR